MFSQSQNQYYDFKSSIQNKFRFDNKKSFTEIIDSNIEPNPITYIPKNTFLKVLMIAEKPSIAKTLSQILCKNKSSYRNLTRQKEWCHYSFLGKFKGKRAHFTISSVAGHLYENDFLRMHQNAQYMDPGKLFDVQTVKTESDGDTQITENWLKDLAKDKDILCLWLDCDAEGENICYEVIYNVLPYMNKRKYQQIYRAIFSSLSEEDIRKSFEQLSNYPDDKLSLSVDARGIIDLKVGVSLTRFLTNEILSILPKDIKTNVLSYGPCQTPTLWFCVDRMRKLMNKKINLCYKIYLNVQIDSNNKIKIYLDEKYEDKSKVDNLVENIKKINLLEIKDIEIENRTKSHPVGLNTANMLKIASEQLKFSPGHAMNLAQRLYTQGLISYPRTETTQYSKNYDFNTNLNKFVKNNNDIRELMNNLDENILMLNEGIDMGDHPPITPINIIRDKKRFKDNEIKLYELICNYYFASLSPDMKYDNIKYNLKINNIKYTSTCSLIKEIGFAKFIPYEQKEFITENELLKKNKEYEIIEVGYEEMKIDDYITESELIEEMEKNHIGTDASMSTHIDNIVRRGYVNVDNDRKLIPTKLGIALIESLESIDSEIVLPKNRAKIEKFVKNLSDGKDNYENVLNYALDFYKNKYYNISGQVEKLQNIFKKYFN